MKRTLIACAVIACAGGLAIAASPEVDKAIKTMRDTGRDMKSKYKETARGGLAVNVIEC